MDIDIQADVYNVSTQLTYFKILSQSIFEFFS